MTGVPGPNTPGQWGDLRARVISGVAMAAIALGGLAVGGLPWAGLLLAAAVGLAVEWAMLTTGQADGAGAAVLGTTLGAAVIAFLAGWPIAAMGILGLSGLLVLVWQRQPLLLLGVPCIGAGVLGLLWLRADPVVGLANVLFVIVVVCGSDIGAYITGRAVGGRKLAPAISPGKTISGALGGLVFAAIAGLLVAGWASWQGMDGNILRAAGLAVLLALVAQAGDLAESWLKRLVGAKDSSQLIPGHGGLLDRLDALLAVAPIAAILALGLGRGVLLWR